MGWVISGALDNRGGGFRFDRKLWHAPNHIAESERYYGRYGYRYSPSITLQMGILLFDNVSIGIKPAATFRVSFNNLELLLVSAVVGFVGLRCHRLIPMSIPPLALALVAITLSFVIWPTDILKKLCSGE